jgi:hypothetical protein
MATTVDYSSQSRRGGRLERPLGARYVDYLEKYEQRLRGPGPARAASDAAGGGQRGRGSRSGGGCVGSGGIATTTVPRPPNALETARRPVSRQYPGRGGVSWTWAWPLEEGGGGGGGAGAAAAAAPFFSSSASSSSSSRHHHHTLASQLQGAGAMLMPQQSPITDTVRRPNSAPLPPGGMLLFDGSSSSSSSTPRLRRAKHRPTATAEREDGGNARAALRAEPPGPGDPTGSWAGWPVSLRALPPAVYGSDSITRHQEKAGGSSSGGGDAGDWGAAASSSLYVERAPAPTTMRADAGAARAAYADALDGYAAAKRHAVLGAPAVERRYGGGGGSGSSGGGAGSSDGGGGGGTLLPPRVRADTGAARPPSPSGSRWGF